MKYFDFYVKKFSYIASSAEADVSFIPPVQRRRLCKLDKCTLHIINNVFDENVQNIIYSSNNGEIERLLKIISQYKEDKEVSPNLFSCSVHNFPIGFYLLNSRNSILYNAISSGKESFSAGILAAVISKYENVIFCFSDTNGDDFCSAGLNISKNTGDTKYRLIQENKEIQNDTFENYVKLFNGEEGQICSRGFRIERQ